MKNYNKGKISYTFLMELLFIIKFLLLSNYEDFVFISKEKND